jgi:N-carbamoyl-L-amino-acid hydrolase
VNVSETFPAKAAAIAAANGCTLKLTPVFRVKEQPFDTECVALVAAAVEKLGLSSRRMVSGAGHDAVHTATVIPTAMIFTPCLNGLSHNEAESILPEEAEAGTQVLFEAVLARANRVL